MSAPKESMPADAPTKVDETEAPKGAAASSSSSSAFITAPPLIPVVAFGGRAGAGKDTAAAMMAEILAEEGAPFAHSKFATDLRWVLEIITGIPAAETTSAEDKARVVKLPGYTPADLIRRIRNAIVVTTGREPTEDAIDGVASVLTALPRGLVRSLGGTIAATEVGVITRVHIVEMTVGRLLQVLGTEAFRGHVGPDVWVESCHRRRAPGVTTIISDARFDNEVASVRAAGGVSVYIQRAVAHGGAGDGRDTAHASENADASLLALFDHTIVNDGTLEDLKLRLRAIWRSARAMRAVTPPPHVACFACSMLPA